ncbi:hypothetical protein AJ79_07438 [Helicocarpus griseus UAMH5409]|uniref:Uncharacterized protein n=1 Tax=Helicocarpus griseus UAMH5409 TaxID=1447875 RepID=A0A2B7X387_9EURO|nr:hypothetical protein AJ79_07438 [Helicocarpus griseus UAMH5409]
MVDSHRRSASPWDLSLPGGSNNPRPSTSQRQTLLPPLPRLRFPGDGYDYRRPVMATASAPTSSPPPPPQQENVIDLTDEPDNPPHTPPRQAGRTSRPPRFGRNIMADVVDLEGESQNNDQQNLSSPEVQFLGAAVRPAEETRTNGGERRNREAPPTLQGSSLVDMIRRIHRNGPPAAYFRRQQAALEEEIGLMRTRDIARAFPTNTPPFWIGERPLQVEIEDDYPIELDYRTAGFAAGERRQPEPPAYVAPPPPPPGFTRTVGEDDVVVCPNCDHELGTGEDPEKRQIWVAKPCGHVYCGQCTKNRAVSKKRPDTASTSKTRHFSKCVVEGCGKPISQPRAMFQIYL